MFSFLKNHPFAVEAFFDYSIVLTFAIPKHQIQPLIPECLELNTFGENQAFIAVAMVQTKELRPKGFPKFLGNDFFLIGYRTFVRFKTQNGKRLRGLYILKSETDKKKMEFFGNIFTHYNYSTTDIRQERNKEIAEIKSHKSGFKVRLAYSDSENIPLPLASPFADWKEARKFAGPLPFTFTYEQATKKIVIIEGVRQNWNPEPVKVLDCKFPFIDSLNFKEVKLANAFIIRNTPYYWKKGKIEQWN
jgi:uncharacterized protein YqjF (DUF2071 family)